MGRTFLPNWDFTEWIGTAGFSLNVSRANRIEYLSASGAITVHVCLACLADLPILCVIGRSHKCLKVLFCTSPKNF